jgi:hypothetical protein
MCHWSSWLLSELNALVFIIITKRNPETWTIGKICEKFAKWKVVLLWYFNCLGSWGIVSCTPISLPTKKALIIFARIGVFSTFRDTKIR